MLSAKLFEERIIIIDSEAIDYFKTKYLSEVLKPYLGDRLTFLTEFDADDKFLKASKNIPNLFVKNPQQLNVVDMLKSDLLFMTKTGLQQFEEVIECR